MPPYPTQQTHPDTTNTRRWPRYDRIVTCGMGLLYFRSGASPDFWTWGAIPPGKFRTTHFPTDSPKTVRSSSKNHANTRTNTQFRRRSSVAANRSPRTSLKGPPKLQQPRHVPRRNLSSIIPSKRNPILCKFSSPTTPRYPRDPRDSMATRRWNSTVQYGCIQSCCALYCTRRECARYDVGLSRDGWLVEKSC